ncbi:MAG TPA: hypothetical protein VFQ76_21655, partial [Longimicrobiaceae bacterium]|nr:hypothetical protein [Longimicrobiaceae bacterium]
MGDIQTHYSVTHHVIHHLQAVDSDEEYAYLELGNFLTDVSQFRDPTAWIGAKPKIFLLVTDMAGGDTGLDAYTRPPLVLLGSEDARGWTTRMLGEPEPPERRHGALPTFLGHAARYATHLKLSGESRARYQDLASLAADEVDRVFTWAFTQYYPHEHLDFPPVANRWQSEGRMFQRRPWKILAYLDMHLRFVAEELSRIEHQWVLKRALPPSHPDRRDPL